MHWLSTAQKCWQSVPKGKNQDLELARDLTIETLSFIKSYFPTGVACPCSTYLWTGTRAPFYHWYNCYITLYSKQSPWTTIVFVHLRVCCLDQRKPLVTKQKRGDSRSQQKPLYTGEGRQQQAWDKAKLQIYKPDLPWLLHTKYPEF